MPLDTPDLTDLTTISPVIVTFDSNDFANGTGIQTFFLSESTTSAGAERILIENAQAASSVVSKVLTADGTVDFDLTPLNISRTLTGFATVSGHITTIGDSVTIEIKKLSGIIETSVSTATTSQTTSAPENIFMKIPITTTTFKRGDIIRVSVTVTGAGGQFNINPVATATSPSRIDLPFKIR